MKNSAPKWCLRFDTKPAPSHTKQMIGTRATP